MTITWYSDNYKVKLYDQIKLSGLIATNSDSYENYIIENAPLNQYE